MFFFSISLCIQGQLTGWLWAGSSHLFSATQGSSFKCAGVPSVTGTRGCVDNGGGRRSCTLMGDSSTEGVVMCKSQQKEGVFHGCSPAPPLPLTHTPSCPASLIPQEEAPGSYTAGPVGQGDIAPGQSCPEMSSRLTQVSLTEGGFCDLPTPPVTTHSEILCKNAHSWGAGPTTIRSGFSRTFIFLFFRSIS